MLQKRVYRQLCRLNRILNLTHKLPSRKGLVRIIMIFYIVYRKKELGLFKFLDDELALIDKYVEQTDTSIKVDIDGLMNELGIDF